MKARRSARPSTPRSTPTPPRPGKVAGDASGWFVGAGLALLAVASSLSLLWFQRLP